MKRFIYCFICREGINVFNIDMGIVWMLHSSCYSLWLISIWEHYLAVRDQCLLAENYLFWQFAYVRERLKTSARLTEHVSNHSLMFATLNAPQRLPPAPSPHSTESLKSLALDLYLLLLLTYHFYWVFLISTSIQWLSVYISHCCVFYKCEVR